MIGRAGIIAALVVATVSGGISAQEATGRVEGLVLLAAGNQRPGCA